MSYRLVIGTKNWSSWSLRAWLAFKVSGIAFEETLVELRGPESATIIKELSPSARVPVLFINNNESESVVFDSLAICETLAERHPECNLWPHDSDARALARSYCAQMHSGFLALREALPMDFARTLPTPAIDNEVCDQIKRIQSAWQTLLSTYSSNDGFLFGQFSIADCMYAPVVSRFLTYSVPMPVDISRYASRIINLPAMKQWHADAQQEIENGLPDQWVEDMIRNAR